MNSDREYAKNEHYSNKSCGKVFIKKQALTFCQNELKFNYIIIVLPKIEYSRLVPAERWQEPGSAFGHIQPRRVCRCLQSISRVFLSLCVRKHASNVENWTSEHSCYICDCLWLNYIVSFYLLVFWFVCLFFAVGLVQKQKLKKRKKICTIPELFYWFTFF